jgi:MoaA/NifB/PqqE/SkfB family radical SAM enzyme
MNTPRARPVVTLAARLLAAHVARLRAPLKVTFAVTYRCQYRCRTCHIWKREPGAELSTAELLRFVAVNRGVSWLDVTGGEIFLRPDIAEILLAVANEWPDLAVLHFATNGFLADRIVDTTAALARVSRARIVVTVSLDGDEATNDALRGRTGGYRRQVETFNGLRRLAGVQTVFGLTLSAGNVHAVERTLEACARDCPGFRADDLHVNLAQVSAHFYGNEEAEGLEPGQPAVLDALDLVSSRRPRRLTPSSCLERAYLRHLRRYVETGDVPGPCHALRASCFIDPVGTVYPCLAYSVPVGSLRETGMDLRRVWAAWQATALQRQIWRGACPRCLTACDAYPTILGNALAPLRRRPAGVPGRAPDPAT